MRFSESPRRQGSLFPGLRLSPLEEGLALKEAVKFPSRRTRGKREEFLCFVVAALCASLVVLVFELALPATRVIIRFDEVLRMEASQSPLRNPKAP